MNVTLTGNPLSLFDWSGFIPLPMKFSFTKPLPLPEHIAAIDLGSNSFHMIVARLQDGQLSKIDRLREMVRLGAGLDAENKLDEAAIERALSCLARFGQRLKHMPEGSVRIIGTRTLRIATNSEQFLQQAETVLNHPIEVVSGIEEARLIYLGVAHDMDHDPLRQRLVIDIGGGSTELMIGEGYTPVKLESLGLGCVSMSQRFFANGQINRKNTRTALLTVLQRVEPYEHRFNHANWEEAVGASGTVKAVGRILTNLGWCNGEITHEALNKLIDYMIERGEIAKFDLAGLSPERSNVFPGGVMVLSGLFEGLGIKTLKISDSALREGVLYDMVGRYRHEDVRTQSVLQLAEKFTVDNKQAELVKTSVLYLALQVAEKWKLQQEDARFLEWAALLHEIGLGIAHSQHQKHGAYIAEHTDLPGFSRQEQELLALLIRSQRGKLPLGQIKDHSGMKFRALLRLAILLRLAVLLHRSRGPLALPEIKLEPGKSSLSLEFPPQWLAEHPLTQADLENEIEYLKTAEFELTLS